jgi:hypothetical protein
MSFFLLFFSQYQSGVPHCWSGVVPIDVVYRESFCYRWHWQVPPDTSGFFSELVNVLNPDMSVSHGTGGSLTLMDGQPLIFLGSLLGTYIRRLDWFTRNEANSPKKQNTQIN